MLKVRGNYDREKLFTARHEFQFYPSKTSAQVFVDIVLETRAAGYSDREIEELMDMQLNTFEKMMLEAEQLSGAPKHGVRLIEQTA